MLLLNGFDEGTSRYSMDTISPPFVIKLVAQQETDSVARCSRVLCQKFDVPLDTMLTYPIHRFPKDVLQAEDKVHLSQDASSQASSPTMSRL